MLNLHKKCQGIAKDCQGSFDLRPELHAKIVFGPPSEALVTPPSMQKPSQKQQNLTSIGLRSRSPFFLCPMQNLKAVTMGMVTARALFWSNKPNPAMRTPVATLGRTMRMQRGTGHCDGSEKHGFLSSSFSPSRARATAV